MPLGQENLSAETTANEDAEWSTQRPRGKNKKRKEERQKRSNFFNSHAKFPKPQPGMFPQVIDADVIRFEVQNSLDYKEVLLKKIAGEGDIQVRNSLAQQLLTFVVAPFGDRLPREQEGRIMDAMCVSLANVTGQRFGVADKLERSSTEQGQCVRPRDYGYDDDGLYLSDCPALVSDDDADRLLEMKKAQAAFESELGLDERDEPDNLSDYSNWDRTLPASFIEPIRETLKNAEATMLMQSKPQVDSEMQQTETIAPGKEEVETTPMEETISEPKRIVRHPDDLSEEEFEKIDRKLPPWFREMRDLLRQHAEAKILDWQPRHHPYIIAHDIEAFSILVRLDGYALDDMRHCERREASSKKKMRDKSPDKA
jgi:hypothetical protein